MFFIFPSIIVPYSGHLYRKLEKKSIANHGWPQCVGGGALKRLWGCLWRAAGRRRNLTQIKRITQMGGCGVGGKRNGEEGEEEPPRTAISLINSGK
jgi:hypothetical protein